jgi:hypothetical protein
MPPNRSTTRASRPRRPLSPSAITPNALYPLPCPPSSGRGGAMNTSPALCGSEANITPAPATRRPSPTRPLKKACSSVPGLL